MNKIFLLGIIIFVMTTIQCSKDETEDEETVITELPAITEITFGSKWNSPDSTVADTGRTFAPSDTIRYQVKFDSAFGNWFMIKKVWRRNDTLLFSSVALIPLGTKRICGEFRHYDGQNLETGNYNISILYFKADTAVYDSASYNAGVNRNFTIQ
ncbi:MAG: hypothetical protein ABIL66_04935 [candidate division WOR-3 bacterium]